MNHADFCQALALSGKKERKGNVAQVYYHLALVYAARGEQEKVQENLQKAKKEARKGHSEKWLCKIAWLQRQV